MGCMTLALLMVLPAFATSGADTADTAVIGAAAPETTGSYPCGGLYVEATAPRYRQREVPADAPMMVQIGRGGCLEAGETVQVDLIGAETIPFGVYSAADVEAAHGLLRFQPPEPLEPLREYTLRVTLSPKGKSEIPFTVGTGAMRPISGSPEWTFFGVYPEPCDRTAIIDWSLDPADDRDGFSVMGVRRDGEILASALVYSSSGFIGQEIAEGQEEICLEGFQVDASGQEVSAGELCRPVEAVECDISPPCCKQTACGCAGEAAPRAWAWLLPLAWLARTHRKNHREIE